MRPATVLLLTLLIGVSVHSQEDTFLETSRDVLTYGIDSEVTDLLTTLQDQGEERLDAEILVRFEQTRNRTLQARILEFFETRELGLAGPAVAEILQSNAELDNSFLRTAVRYVSRTADIHSPELLIRYEEMATGPDPVAASVAIGAIGADGSEDSVDLLLRLFDDLNREELKGAVVRALGDTLSPDALEMLERIVSDPFEDITLRQYGAEALGKIAHPQSSAVLLALLGDNNSLLRAYAIAALGSFSDEESVTALESALRDSFWRVRVAALQGIAKRGTTSDLDAVVYKARRDPEAPVRQEAVKTLAALASRASYDVLGEIAADPRAAQADRLQAIALLVEHDLGANLELFSRLIEDEWGVENSRILDGVGKGVSTSVDPGLSPVFDRLLTHPNFIIQIYAIRGIGRNGFTEFGDRIISIAGQYPTNILGSTARSTLELLGIELPEETTENGGDGSTPDDAAVIPDADSAD